MGKPGASKPLPNATLADDGTGDAAWRVELLRALVRGDEALLARALHDHVEALSLPFTSLMPPWKVQSESMHWWMLREATPLFLAAAYSHPHLVRWLLLRGADRASRCHLGRTPLDCVGECCESSVATVSADTESKIRLQERSAACSALLVAPPTLPEPPLVGVSFTCHISTQAVVIKLPTTARSSLSLASTPAKAGAVAPQQQQHTQLVHKCLVDMTWETPLSNGAIIEKYEVRHRLIAADGEEMPLAAGDYGDGGGEPGSSTNGVCSDGKGVVAGSWRTERATHNRKSQQQAVVLEGLQFESTYEFMVRSWNAEGKGDWGRVYKFKTLASPEQQHQQQ